MFFLNVFLKARSLVGAVMKNSAWMKTFATKARWLANGNGTERSRAMWNTLESKLEPKAWWPSGAAENQPRGGEMH